ncbi:hypothetical protein E1292_33210 [Nonomuraea deserti]|uniref:Thiamine pyrophosphate enzyme TPP-binding domain-containing protein n=1 Tax=Nonomuraea deserti TaxID=1848322 RepID=A0A4R4V1Y9_9ACTN|nr:hypothetical protein [Nonomuraea deserti]TDC99047.1 hypothetical protein E1292_33210 [Nonomuraea deserti]
MPRAYGVLRGIVRGTGEGAAEDVDLVTPDFAALGASFGIATRRITDAAGFDTEFAAAVTRPGPTLLDIDLTALAPIRR